MSKTLKDNLSFILICLLIFAAILAVAYILEKLLVKDRKKLGSTHFISYTAIFSAMAGFLMFLEIPLFFAPAFYEIDLRLSLSVCDIGISSTNKKSPERTISLRCSHIEHLLSSRLYCRYRNHTGSYQMARGLYRRSGISPCPEDISFIRLCLYYSPRKQFVNSSLTFFSSWHIMPMREKV